MSTSTSRTHEYERRAEPLRLLPNSSRRRPALAAASLLLVAMCVLIFTTLYLHAGRSVAVLVVERRVPEGQRSVVLGQRAAVALVPGTLLVTNDLTSQSPISQGTAIVGVALALDQLPAQGVASDSSVEIILTGPSGSPNSALNGSLSAPGGTGDEAVLGNSSDIIPIGTVLVSSAQVVATEAVPTGSSGTDTEVVSVRIPSRLAPIVANASAAGQAALVEIASPS